MKMNTIALHNAKCRFIRDLGDGMGHGVIGVKYEQIVHRFMPPSTYIGMNTAHPKLHRERTMWFWHGLKNSCHRDFIQTYRELSSITANTSCLQSLNVTGLGTFEHLGCCGYSEFFYYFCSVIQIHLPIFIYTLGIHVSISPAHPLLHAQSK
jgi:hypothetical protein